MLNSGVLQYDAAGRILTSSNLPVGYNAGVPYDSQGNLAVSFTTPVMFTNGMPYAANGQLCVTSASPASFTQGGLPISAAGGVAVAIGGAIHHRIAGLPMTSGSRLIIATAAIVTDPFFSSVVLLAGNENAAAGSTTFVDQSSFAHPITRVGDAVWTEASAPPGVATSIASDGSGDGLRVASTPVMNLGSGPWTVEMMANFNAVAVTTFLWTATGSVGSLQRIVATLNLQMFWNGVNLVNSPSGIALGAWNHIAVTRDAAGNMRQFANGVQKGATILDPSAQPSDAIFNISIDGSGNGSINGLISNFRMTKGVARYTANFAPPVLPFPTAAASASPPSANRVGWYRYGVGITQAGGFVSQWADQSGAGNHMVQAVGVSQPSIGTEGELVFDGVDDFLRAAFTLVQPASIYFLFKQITNTSGDAIIGGATTAARALQAAASPQLNFNAGVNMGFNGELALGNWQAGGVVANGVSSVLMMDAPANEVLGDVGVNPFGGVTLAALSTGASSWANVAIKEVIVYNVAHDAPTRAQVMNYLRAVGGLTW